MSQLTPTPGTVEKFNQIWKNWLDKLHDFLNRHTGGSTPTSPATGTSWNAHGNTATGSSNTADTNTGILHINEGTFLIGKAGTPAEQVGNTPDIDQEGTYLSFSPANGAFRVGTINSNGSYGTDPWSDANTGQDSIGIGVNSKIKGLKGISIGQDNNVTGATSMCLGNENQATATYAAMLGHQGKAGGINSSAVGFQAEALGQNSVAVGNKVRADATNAVIIGKGTPGAYFENPTAASMYIGVGNTTYPTMRLQQNKVAICSTADFEPQSTLDVGGSVGFQHDELGPTPISSTLKDITISNITAGSGNIAVVTIDTASTYDNGDTVVITGTNSNPDINGTWTVTKNSTTEFQFDRGTPIIDDGDTGTASMPENPVLITTSRSHNIKDQENVKISGVSGGVYSAAINATHVATVIDSTSFTIPINCTTAGDVTNAVANPVLDDQQLVLDSADNQYTFRVDVQDLTSESDVYEITLPVISTIPRRIFYFKVVDTGSTTVRTRGFLRIKPQGTDKMERRLRNGDFQGVADVAGGSGGRILLDVGEAVTVIANDTDNTWWAI
jgi:hypothetical protein